MKCFFGIINILCVAFALSAQTTNKPEKIVQWLKEYTEKYYSDNIVSRTITIDLETLSLEVVEKNKKQINKNTCMLSDLELDKISFSNTTDGSTGKNYPSVWLTTKSHDLKLIKTEAKGYDGYTCDPIWNYAICIDYGNEEIAKRAVKAWIDIIKIAKERSPY
jgi:hypothetical protein